MVILIIKLTTTAHSWCSGHTTKYKYLYGVGSKGWGSNFQEGTSNTYTLELSQSRNCILYQNNNNNNNNNQTHYNIITY